MLGGLSFEMREMAQGGNPRRAPVDVRTLDPAWHLLAIPQRPISTGGALDGAVDKAHIRLQDW